MRGARKMMWQRFGLTLSGLIFGMMLCSVSGCNDQDDAALMAQQLAQQGGGGAAPRATQQQPMTLPPGLNPCGEAVPEEDLGYTGPVVEVTEFSVKLPYEGYEGARRFDIVCTVQAEKFVDSKAIWEILALDATGKVVGTQKQHLSIPHEYSKPLDINSFYCGAVPASLEFRYTGKTAIPVGEDAQANSGKGGNSVGRGSIK